MYDLPPKITHNTEGVIDNSTISKARNLYKSAESVLKLGGLRSIIRRYNVNGYGITIQVYKNSISSYLYGYINLEYGDIAKPEEKIKAISYINIDINTTSNSGNTVISAIYPSTIKSSFPDDPLTELVDSLFNSYEYIIPVSEDDPVQNPVNQVCISHNYSDTDEIINFAGCQSAYGYYTGIPDPKIGALVVYKGTRYFGLGDFVFDARVKSGVLFILSGFGGVNPYLVLHATSIIESSVEDISLDITSAITTISGSGFLITFGDGSEYSVPTDSVARVMSGKINPSCTAFDILCTGEQDDPDDGIGINKIYYSWDITTPFSIDIEKGSKDSLFYITTDQSSVYYPNEIYYIEYSAEVTQITDTLQVLINPTWYGTTDPFIDGVGSNPISSYIDVDGSYTEDVHYNDPSEISLDRWVSHSGSLKLFISGVPLVEGDITTTVTGFTDVTVDTNPISKVFGVSTTYVIRENGIIIDERVSGKTLDLNNYIITVDTNYVDKNIHKCMVGDGYKVGFNYDDTPASKTYGNRYWEIFRSDVPIDQTSSKSTIEYRYQKPSKGGTIDGVFYTTSGPSVDHPSYSSILNWFSSYPRIDTTTKNIIGLGKVASGVFSNDLLVNNIGTYYDDTALAGLSFSKNNVWSLVGLSWINTEKLRSYGGPDVYSSSGHRYEEFFGTFHSQEGATYPTSFFGSNSVNKTSQQRAEPTPLPTSGSITKYDGFNVYRLEDMTKYICIDSVKNNYGYAATAETLLRQEWDPYLNEEIPTDTSNYYSRNSSGLFSVKPDQAFRFEILPEVYLVTTSFLRAVDKFTSLDRNELWLEDSEGTLLLKINNIITRYYSNLDINNSNDINSRLTAGAAHIQQ